MSGAARTQAERLRDPDPEVRYRALQEADPSGLDLLLERLSDESWRVRRAAVERIVTWSEPVRAVPSLVDKLADGDDVGARNSAAEALARIGAPAIAVLAARVGDPDADVRKFVCDVLGEIGREEGVAPLLLALAEEDRNVRSAAAEALGKIGGARAIAALEERLEEADELFVGAVLDALARAGHAPPLVALMPLLRRRLLRRPAYRLMGLGRDPAALPVLLDGLGDGSRGVREAALAGLAAWRRKDGSGPLARALKATPPGPVAPEERAREALASTEPLVVEGAVAILGFAGRASDAPALAMAGADEQVREAALEAMAAMGPSAARVLLQSFDELPLPARPVAIEVFARLRERDATPLLVALASDAEDALRLAAITALGEVACEAAIEPLFALLEDPQVAVAAARALAVLGKLERRAVREGCLRHLGGDGAEWALRVLGAVGSREDLQTLRGALKSEVPEHRVAAAEAAGALREPQAEEMLRAALWDEAAAVRAGAARGLGSLPGDGPLQALLAALEDRDPEVVASAAEALGARRDLRAVPALAKALERNAAGSADPVAAIAAIRALGRLGGATAALLAGAVRAGDPEAAKEALEVAATLPDSAELLLEAAGHARWDVRQAAAKALAARGDRALLGQVERMAAAETDPLVEAAFDDALRALRRRPGER